MLGTNELSKGSIRNELLISKPLIQASFPQKFMSILTMFLDRISLLKRRVNVHWISFGPPVRLLQTKQNVLVSCPDRNLLLFVWPQTECLDMAGFWVWFFWWDAPWYYIVISSLPYNSLCKHNLIMKKYPRIQNICTFLDFIMQYITRYYILYTTIMAFFFRIHIMNVLCGSLRLSSIRQHPPVAPHFGLPVSGSHEHTHKWTLGRRFCRIRNSTRIAHRGIRPQWDMPCMDHYGTHSGSAYGRWNGAMKLFAFFVSFLCFFFFFLLFWIKNRFSFIFMVVMAHTMSLSRT